MTQMTFTLSSALQAELKAQPDSYVYALQYSAGTFVGSVATLVSKGVYTPTDKTAGTYSVDLPSSFASGQVYVLVQPKGDGTLGTTISKLNSGNVNAISVATAQQYGFKYQLLEATLSGSTGDLGDISSVNTFGFPVTFSDVNGTRGFAPGFVGTTPTGVSPAGFTNGLPTGSVLSKAANLAVGPAQGSSLDPNNPWPPGNWKTYVDALKGSPSTLADITIVTAFSDPKQPTIPPTLSQYGVVYDLAKYGDYFVMVPNTTNGANNTDFIRISPANLQNAIYAQLGPIDTAPMVNGQPGTWTTQTTTTPNTPDGQVAKYFVAGFDAGYWGATAHAPNPLDSTVIDLNKTANWNFNYAYAGAFNPAKTTGVVVTNTLSKFVDTWAQSIQLNSNTYGWSYGDLISQGGTNPQISLWDPKGKQVDNIGITLYSSAETIPANSGFLPMPPSYVAPTGSTYKDVNTPINIQTNNNANLISVNFTESAGTLSLNPNAATPAFFKFYAPSDSQADKSTGFVSLSLTIADPTTGIVSDWNNVNVKGSPGAWSLQKFSANTTGNFNIYNMPVTSDGSTGWYQIVFGGKGQETVYNFYAKSDSAGHFINISTDPTGFVTDHGLGYGPGLGTTWMTGLATGQTGYTLTLAPSGVMTYDINTLSAPGTLYGTNGSDTLLGTSNDDMLVGAPANDTITGGAGVDTAVFWEPARNFALTTNARTDTFVAKDKVGVDGTDTLISIEKMQFTDRTLGLDTVTKTASLATDQIMKIVDLYTAGLNRAPDAVGLSYWASKLADGVKLADISAQFFKMPEAAPIYSTGNSNPVFVDLAYQTAVGHAPDAATRAFWLDQLDSGKLARTDFVTALVATVTGTDKQYVANKETVGAHFALTAGLNNGLSARAVESSVDATLASVAAGNAKTDAFAVVAAAPGTSELVVQILGIVA